MSLEMCLWYERLEINNEHAKCGAVGMNPEVDMTTKNLNPINPFHFLLNCIKIYQRLVFLMDIHWIYVVVKNTAFHMQAYFATAETDF